MLTSRIISIVLSRAECGEVLQVLKDAKLMEKGLPKVP
jgi:hypothetical protein